MSRDAPPHRLVPTARRVGLVVATLLAAVAATLLASVAATAQITTDGSVGPAQTLAGPDYQIPATLGSQSGSTLFHSFLTFDVPGGGSATFTPDGLSGPVSHLIGRVTGGDPSEIAGRLASQVGEQHFILLNPAGIAFTEGSSVDVPGSLHVTTADRVGFGDGRFFSASDLGGSPLSVDVPTSFGFLDGAIPAPIDIEGFIEVGIGDSISLVGGDITIASTANPLADGVVSAVDGDVLLVAVGSGGTVQGILGPASDVTLDGFTALGDIAVIDGAIVSSSGISPIFGTPVTAGGAVPPAQLDAPFVRVDGSQDRLASVIINPPSPQPDDVLLGFDADGRSYYLRPRDRGGEGAGQVRAIGRNLTIDDASLRAATAGDGDSGGIAIELDGNLTIRRDDAFGDVGLFTNAGIRVTGDQTVFVFSGGQFVRLFFEDVDLDLGGTGRGGDIDITAANLTLQDGGRISASSIAAGEGGDVTVDVRDTVTIAGGDPARRSAIFSNAGGTGDGGVISIRGTDTVRLVDGGRIIAATSGDADAGDILLDVGRLELLGASQIDNSSSGATLDPGSPEVTLGNGGRIEIQASQGILVAGIPGDESSAQISTLSQVRTSGDAGAIDITTPDLVVRDSGNISVTTDGAGDGGGIAIDAATVSLASGAFLSAASTGTSADLGATPGAAGSIAVGAEGLDATHSLRSLQLESARITTFAAEGPPAPPNPADAAALREGNIRVASSGIVQLAYGSDLEASVGEGLGGRVEVRAEDGLVLRDASRVLARAVGSGQGGRIAISAGAFFVSPDSEVRADAGVGVDGEVLIDSPETSAENDLASLDVAFADASAFVRPTCAARAAGIGGSFTVASDTSAVRKPEGVLWISDRLPGIPADAALDRALADGDLDTAMRRLARRADADGGATGSRSDAAVEHDEANLSVLRGETTAAHDAFLTLAARSRQRGHAGLERAALASAAHLDLASGDVAAARRRLEAATPKGPLRSDLDAATAMHAAAGWRRLADADPAARDAGVLAAHGALLAAARRAQSEGDAALLAEAQGELGTLYADEGRHDEAIEALGRAIATSRQHDRTAGVHRWHARRAAAFWAQGRAAPALSAHRRALAALEAERQQSANPYGATGASFLTRNEPLYLDYIDALLTSAERVPESGAQTEILLEARRIMEQLRAAELRDYFRDECIASLESRTLDLDTLLTRGGVRAAVIYPIPLEDRLELLVTLPSGVRRYASPVGAARLGEVADFFQRRVRSGSRQYLAPARQLHEWLVAPLADDLAESGVDTLVVVPGGRLASLPFAALHDGDGFLIERYAVAVAPGLSLVDPAPLDPNQEHFLLAGISEAEAGFEPLPNVRDEIEQLESAYGGSVLLDEGFQRAPFERRLADEQPGVVHIASHAVFGDGPASSFILTHGGRISLDEMAATLRRTQYREQPVEMLVLSACETAAGDSRAALGLAGIAIRSGVRSALGSLWSIGDEATASLMVDFYAALEDPDVHKAEALRRAQRALLEDGVHRHPRHWSAFVLLSNWL